VTSIHLGEIEEDDHRRIANRGVMASEFEAAGLAIHLEDGNVVGSLIATIEELTSGVEVEAARIVPSCPFFPYEREVAVWANGKDPDAALETASVLPATLTSRHVIGDWGDLDDNDKKRNDEAIQIGSRILSAYLLANGVKVWIITEAADDQGKRAATTYYRTNTDLSNR
jgi:hypothetical protein